MALVPGLGDVPRTAAGLIIFGGVVLALRAVPEELLVEARKALAGLRAR
jgi:hypothetical protein